MWLQSSKIHHTRGWIERARFGRRLMMLGLVSAALLIGGIAFALPMGTNDASVKPEAAITLKSSATSSITPPLSNSPDQETEPIEVKKNQTINVTVNGENIEVPENGSSQQVIPTEDGEVIVNTQATSGNSANSSSSSLNIQVNGSGTVNSQTQTQGGSSSINILSH